MTKYNFLSLNHFGISKNGYTSQLGHDGLSNKYAIPENIKEQFDLNDYNNLCFISQTNLNRHFICAIPKNGGPYKVIARPDSNNEIKKIIENDELDENGLARLVKDEAKRLKNY